METGAQRSASKPHFLSPDEKVPSLCWTELTRLPPCRPLPYSQTLVSSISRKEKSKLSPLLQDFYLAHGKSLDETGGDTSSSDEDADPEENREPEQTEMLALDDPSLSKLTSLQHERFLKLKSLADESSLSSWKEATRKEFQRLKRLVAEDQELYHQKLLAFWLTQRDRLIVGFRAMDKEGAAQFVTTAFNYHDYIHRFLTRCTIDTSPLRYHAKCSQIMSLCVDDEYSKLSIDLISAETLNVLDQNSSHACIVGKLPEPGSQIPIPRRDALSKRFSHISSLQDDLTLENLALQYKVDIVTTEETVSIVLQGTMAGSQWMIPVAHRSVGSGTLSSTQVRDIAFLEFPAPQAFNSPRQCLEQGLEHAVYQWLEEDQEATEFKPQEYKYSYRLLKLYSNRDRPPLRVLVRSRTERLYCKVEDSSEKVRPMRVHTRVEYFKNRGKEEASSNERALWTLDHLLCGPKARVVVCRIDPTPSTCVCLGWQEVSLADAVTEHDKGMAGGPLATGDHQTKNSADEAIFHWKVLASFFKAVRTCGRGQHLVVFPARQDKSNSVGAALASNSTLVASVHKAATNTNDAVSSRKSSGSNDTVINVQEEIASAREVPLDARAILRSFRHWQWEHPRRVPHTFPPKA